eukprot:TRINITY_DN2168_c0_g1_i4.p1 TRINITY_DN2168_c0_g1~~TRINITY_DN2168_c0_g1_i4.p1  ORF type:complete len:530 (-),score=95.64 TRINITY_DN2168_c0_g1_i4:191-1780(-)
MNENNTTEVIVENEGAEIEQRELKQINNMSESSLNSSTAPLAVEVELKSSSTESIPPTTQNDDVKTEAITQLEINEKLEQNQEPMSIYDLYSKKKSTLLLLISALGCLQMPLADTIYFPSLKNVADDFNTSMGVVALTIALFMFLVGVASLVWGPAADYFGRKKTFIVSFIGYLGCNVVCMLAPSVVVLIIFRAFQGAFISAFLTVCCSVIADVYPLERRGAALGMFSIPLNVGPIVGPILGGVLGYSKGWRSTFLLLIVLGAALFVVIIAIVPETHQWYVLRRLNKKDPIRRSRIIEASEITSQDPVFMSPVKTFLLAFKPYVSPYLAVCCMEFGAFYGALTLFSPVMASPPYNYNQSIIGVLYIPMGVGAMIAAIIGGRISDWSAMRSTVPEARMYYNIIVSSAAFLPGIMIYGWCIQYQTNIAAILISMFFMGFGCNSYFPSVLAYVGGVNQKEAAAASASMFCVVLVSGGIASEVVVFIAAAINYGPLACFLVGLWIIPTVISLIIIKRKMIKAESEAEQKTVQP